MKSAVEINEVNLDIILGLHVIFSDYAKMEMWLKTPNLNFGGASPLQIINKGRAHKVQEFINAAIERNEHGTVTGKEREMAVADGHQNK